MIFVIDCLLIIIVSLIDYGIYVLDMSIKIYLIYQVEGWKINARSLTRN